jgi:transcriptional regulator with XRE-family HTH domain
MIETMLPDDVGTRVHQARVLKAKSQTQLAKEIGMRQETIYRIEMGLNVPRLSTISKIAGALGMPVEYFTRPTNDRELKEDL